MNRRELIFGLCGIIGTVFAFWVFWYDRPSREISYYHEPKPLVSVEAFGSTELELDGQRITEGTIYRNRLFIWNSGNRELASDDFGEPIQWSNAPIAIQWSELPIKTDMTFHGIRKDQIDGELIPGPITGGLRFKKLYPKTGLELTFLTRSVPDISLSGSVSGDSSSSGIIKRKKINIPDIYMYQLGIWGVVYLICIGFAWRTLRPASFGAYAQLLGITAVMSSAPIILLGALYRTWLNFDLPPF